MNLYPLVKFLHVLAAIIWLGGGFCLMVMAVIADARRDERDLVHVMQKVVFLSNRMFVPASLLTLVCGLALVLMVWGFSAFWILLALGGFAFSFATGVGVLKPRADRLAADVAKDGFSEDIVRQCRVLLGIAKFDFTVLFMIVAVMVLKPGPSDIGTLSACAAVLGLAALGFLLPLRRFQAAAA